MPLKKMVLTVVPLKKSYLHLCAIDLNFFALYVIPSILASNGVKWTGEMTILPLQPRATNSPFFYLYATQFSKSQHHFLLPICHHFSKSEQQTHCYLNDRITNIFYLGKNASLVFKLILDKIINITNTSLCFKSIHHIIINITDTHLFKFIS
jgi:hypothetical protein